MWEPFGEAPANSTGQWKEGPRERGTFGILSTCLFTLILCVYSCLHLNIPSPSRATWWHKMRHRAWWGFVGLVAPEVVAFIALRDWHAARRLDDDMARLLPTKPPPEYYAPIGSPGSRSHCWTRIHSHLALMGGFAVDLSTLLGPYDRSFLNKTRRMLKPAALRLIARYAPEILPDISQQVILDKSKASGLGKFLPCLQAFWFSLQVVGRLVTGLPISLLELNVLLHAVCCFCIYMAWWNKPLDIEEPFTLDVSDRTQQVCAWLMLEDHPLRSYPCRDYSSGEWELFYVGDSQAPAYAAPDDREMRQHGYTFSFQAQRVDNSVERIQHQLGQNKDHMTLRLYGDQVCYGFAVRPVHTGSYYDDPVRTEYKPETAWVELTSPEITRLRLVHLMNANGSGWSFSHKSYCPPGRMFIDETTLMSSPDDDFQGWDEFYATGLMLAGTIYGGLHLLAWNGPFVSTGEQWLWRYACMTIASPGPLALIYRLHPVIDVIHKQMIQPGSEVLKNCLGDCATLFIQILCGCSAYLVTMMALATYALVYIAARLYLITECLTSLAHLPPEVYVEPSWSRYLPHWGAG
ncbi:uncharacterized protein M421DRAFT_338869 [Didymella exigua CBS 183.55]|uniref:Uncharacterized protein n=1 Tax=Didymella exigua CBS 183.55 TaxID=1150837 RepID=A0A6A5RRT8_9PLEO|nr:uncharacterized protein M421DRAFT_338869 [Didymella exigua CBS 183.55]KAF1931065.1 hypothetical protein M421DRAFT_338869 [Didymella exigua CBS 183.55]